MIGDINMRKIWGKQSKIIQLPFLLLLAISVLFLAMPAAAYDVVVPGDLDGDLIVSDEELEAAEESYDEVELEKIQQIHDNYPRTIIDSADREVTFYKPPERIIPMGPDSARIVIALGLEDKIIAGEECVRNCICPVSTTTSSEVYDRGCMNCFGTLLEGRLAELPVIATRYDTYYEQIASLEPDLIITSSESEAHELEDKVGCLCVVASGSGWTYSYDDESGLYSQIEVMGNLLDREDEADELVNFIESKIDMIRSVTDTLEESEKPKVYFASRGATKGFYDPKEGRDFTRTVSSYGPLSIAGGINVAEECEGSSINVGIEQIIAWDPDYIFLGCSSPDNKDAIEFILTSSELQSITAVQNGNVCNCFYPHCRGSPPDRNLFNIIYMAKLLHPDKFEDLDMERECNEIFEAFLGVDGVFTEYADYLVWPREYLDSQ
jgi:iron complex transport system substrate-binding protein